MMLANNTYTNMLKEDMMFCIQEKFSQEYLDNMLPFERELFIHEFKEIQKQKQKESEEQKQNLTSSMPKVPRMR